jgi:hypothetical protein
LMNTLIRPFMAVCPKQLSQAKMVPYWWKAFSSQIQQDSSRLTISSVDSGASIWCRKTLSTLTDLEFTCANRNIQWSLVFTYRHLWKNTSTLWHIFWTRETRKKSYPTKFHSISWSIIT